MTHYVHPQGLCESGDMVGAASLFEQYLLSNPPELLRALATEQLAIFRSHPCGSQ